MRHTISPSALRGLDDRDGAGKWETQRPASQASAGRLQFYAFCFVTLCRGRFSPMRVGPPSLVKA